MRKTNCMLLQSPPLKAFSWFQTLDTDKVKEVARDQLEITLQCVRVCDLWPAAVLCPWRSWAEWQPASGSCLQQRFHRCWRCGPQSGKGRVVCSLIANTGGTHAWQILEWSSNFYRKLEEVNFLGMKCWTEVAQYVFNAAQDKKNSVYADIRGKTMLALRSVISNMQHCLLSFWTNS